MESYHYVPVEEVEHVGMDERSCQIMSQAVVGSVAEQRRQYNLQWKEGKVQRHNDNLRHFTGRNKGTVYIRGIPR